MCNRPHLHFHPAFIHNLTSIVNAKLFEGSLNTRKYCTCTRYSTGIRTWILQYILANYWCTCRLPWSTPYPWFQVGRDEHLPCRRRRERHCPPTGGVTGGQKIFTQVLTNQKENAECSMTRGVRDYWRLHKSLLPPPPLPSTSIPPLLLHTPPTTCTHPS